jgi:hypothetical protein
VDARAGRAIQVDNEEAVGHGRRDRILRNPAVVPVPFDEAREAPTARGQLQYVHVELPVKNIIEIKREIVNTLRRRAASIKHPSDVRPAVIQSATLMSSEYRAARQDHVMNAVYSLGAARLPVHTLVELRGGVRHFGAYYTSAA